jgi:hypothetical protein
MDSTQLASLNAAVDDCLAAQPTFENARDYFARLDALGDVLQTLPGPWSHLWYMRASDGAASLVSPRTYAHAFAHYMSEKRDVAAALSRIDDELAAPHANGAYYCEVLGPEVEDAVTVADRISIVPGFPPIPAVYGLSVQRGGHNRPRCCIRIASDVQTPFFRLAKGEKWPQVPSDMSLHQISTDLPNVLAAVLAPCPITPTWSTFSFAASGHRLLENHFFGLHGYPPSYWDLPYPQRGRVETSTLQAAWAGFQAMPKKDRERMRLICGRINRASMQLNISFADACIEAAIALEAMFGGGSKDSVTYKLSTRAARFLATETEERIRLQSLFKRVYVARSDIVHGNTADPGLERQELAEFCALVANAAVRMMTAGCLPTNQTLDFG